LQYDRILGRYILLNTAPTVTKCFHIGLFSYASRPKDNKNVDKQKNNADLNEIELLQSQDYVRGEV